MVQKDDLRRPSLPDSPELALTLSRLMSGPLAFVGYALPPDWTNGTWVSGTMGYEDLGAKRVFLSEKFMSSASQVFVI